MLAAFGQWVKNTYFRGLTSFSFDNFGERFDYFFNAVMNSATANILQLINHLKDCQRCIYKMTATPFSVLRITDFKIKTNYN